MDTEQWGKIGSIRRDLEQAEVALANYHRALSRCRELGEMERVADQYTNIAYISFMKMDFAEALILIITN
jgi:hypothetical protein